MKRKRSILRLFILAAIYFLVANFAHPVEPTFYKLLELPDYMFGVAFAAMATTVFPPMGLNPVLTKQFTLFVDLTPSTK